MKTTVTRYTAIAAVIASGCLAPAHAVIAQDYPTKPVRLIVPFVPGGGTDFTGRTVAHKLSEMWGQQVVVDNRPGAAGSIGVDITAQATPDGYTLCLISASHTVNAAVNKKLPYDLTRDLQGLMQATSLFYVVSVNTSLPIKSVKDLVGYAGAHPGELHFGSSGTFGLQHFAGELFAHLSKTKMTHVPYKGGAASTAAAARGETQVGFTTFTSARPHVQAGRLRLLAITATKRSPIAPELPTVAEAGVPGYEVDQWYGFITSAKVPREIVRRISTAMMQAAKSPDVVKRFAAEGSTAVGSTPGAFSAHVKSEIAKWSKLVTEANLRLR